MAKTKSKNEKGRIYILSVGGSLIVPGEVDVDFLKNFHAFIRKKAGQGNKFVIICGGGALARRYQQAAKDLGNFALKNLDWLGIYATFMNALLLKTALGDICHYQVMSDPYEKVKITKSKPIVVAGGYRPGWSTDFDSVTSARAYGAKTVVNLSNIDYVYDKDPKKFPDAKIIKKISWGDFQKIVGTKWRPGLNVPFDPIAAKLAKKHKIRVVILNGRNLENFKNCLEGKDYKGTIIE